MRNDEFLRAIEHPIEVLNLSPHVSRALKWEGLTTVGDCLLFYANDAARHFTVSRYMYGFMYSEVFERLIALDYWRFIEDYECWRFLEAQLGRHFVPKRITMWQGQERNLYEVSVEELGLSRRAMAALRYRRLETLIDCANMYHYSQLELPQRVVQPFDPEIAKKLHEIEYWLYIQTVDSL